MTTIFSPPKLFAVVEIMLILCRFVAARREAVFFLSDKKHQKHTKIWAKSGVCGSGGIRESGEFQEFLFIPPLPTLHGGTKSISFVVQ